MNSLEELNLWNDGLSIDYTDLRIANLTFNRATTENQQVIVNEGSTFISPVGIEIEDVINPSVSLPTYTIDLTNGPTDIDVVWDEIPAGCILTQVTAKIWRISGITTVDDWNIVKNPRIELPGGLPESYFGTFVYTSTISYINGNSGPETKSWLINTVVLNVDILNQPLETVYKQNSSNAVDYPPTIAFDDNWPGAIWTLVGTPDTISSIENWTSTSSLGGTFTVNNTTKVFTIVGTTPQVNEYVNNLRLESNFLTLDFIVTYVVTNNIDSITDSKIQTFRNSNILYLSNPTQTTQFYQEDGDYFDVNGTPTITDLAYTGDRDYILEIVSSDPDAIVDMTAEPNDPLIEGGTSNFDPITKILTIQGSKIEVNNRLLTFKFKVIGDYEENFVFSYSVLTPQFYTATKLQNIVCNSNDTEVSNLSITREYIGNQENLIFSANTPQVIDFDTTPSNTYGFTLNCSFGEWSLNGTTISNPVSFSGTREQVNSVLSEVRFYPNLNFSSNGTFTYTHIKNGVSVFTNNIALNGTAGTYIEKEINFLVSQTWTPSLADVKYAKVIELLVVGGGGGGSTDGGGGGGGQVKYSSTEFNLENQTYTITIGVGGATANIAFNGGNSEAFGITAFGGRGGDGVNGGGSYAPNGTFFNGGTGGGWMSSGAFDGDDGVCGGGGAGSGGALPYGLKYTNGTQPDNINAFLPYVQNTSKTPASGGGGIGAVVGSRWQINYPADPLTERTGSSYGSGGVGGNYSPDSVLASTGFNFKFTDTDGISRDFGNAAQVLDFSSILQQAGATDYVVEGVRRPEVAGQGGGGGARQTAYPGAQGGSGIVRMYLIGK